MEIFPVAAGFASGFRGEEGVPEEITFRGEEGMSATFFL